MKRLLIKFAYSILRHYSLEGLSYVYCCNKEYKVIGVEIKSDGRLKIKAERLNNEK